MVCYAQWTCKGETSPEPCLHLFIDGLPLGEDLEQALCTHELLLAFVQEGHPFFQKQWSKIFRIFLEVHDKPGTSTETLNAGIRQLFIEKGETGFRKIQPALSEKERKRVQKICMDSRTASSTTS